MSKLYDQYWERFAEEPGLSLDDFLDEVAAGDHGPYERDDILAFIDEVEANSLANIETKAQEAPQFEAMKEAAAERVLAQSRRLRARFQ